MEAALEVLLSEPLASTGPTTFVVGESRPSRSTTRSASRRFNGADDLRRRRARSSSRSPARPRRSFNGADDLRRRRAGRGDISHDASPVLQRGRRPSSSERGSNGQRSGIPCAKASTGPTTFVVGEAAPILAREHPRLASTGPTTFVVGEQRARPRGCGRGARLQRGRRPSSSESRRRRRARPAVRLSFNGADDLRRRRALDDCGGLTGEGEASTGPTTFVVGEP